MFSVNSKKRAEQYSLPENKEVIVQTNNHDCLDSISEKEILLREYGRIKHELEEDREQLLKKYQKPNWFWRFLFGDDEAKKIEDFTHTIELLTDEEQSTWKLLRRLYAFRAVHRVGFWLFE